MTDWVRLWHDMPTDPKWRTIARKSGQPLPCVIALFTFMLTNASANADDRGTLLSWDHEDAAAGLDIEPECVAAIFDAMQGKVLDGFRLRGWEKRQVECMNGSTGSGTKSYLYVITNSETQAVKIGTSRNPWARAKDLQTGTTGKTTVAASFAGIRSDETEVHRLLARYRQSGEWFKLPQKLIEAILAAHAAKQSSKELLVSLRAQLPSSDGSYEETETYTDTDNTPPTPPRGKVSVPEWVPPEPWAGFTSMRVKIKKPLTPRAQTMALNKLQELRDAGEDPAKVLDQSTLHCWQDLYPVKARDGPNVREAADVIRI